MEIYVKSEYYSSLLAQSLIPYSIGFNFYRVDHFHLVFEIDESSLKMAEENGFILPEFCDNETIATVYILV